MSKKIKFIFIGVVILVLIALGVFSGFSLIQRFQSKSIPIISEEYIVKKDVVVVTRDLALGDRVNASDVELVSIPVELAPRTAIENLDEVIDKIVKTDLVQGEMVLTHNLAEPTNNIHDLSFILGDDHVLMAFPANDLLSRENMIKRGDIVDIFATFTQKVKSSDENNAPNGEAAEPEAKTYTVDALQKVEVTALVLEVLTEDENSGVALQTQNEESTSASNTRIRAYLLALDSQNALLLKYLKDTGAEFDIVLRASTSEEEFDLTPITEEYISEFYGLEILP